MTADDIIQGVCDATGVSPQGLTGPCRSYALTHPRHLAFYLLHDLLGLSSSAIGRLMDRDHTTVIHGLKRAAELLETNAAFREWHAKVMERLAMGRAA